MIVIGYDIENKKIDTIALLSITKDASKNVKKMKNKLDILLCFEKV